jgi:hypothetical protein
VAQNNEIFNRLKAQYEKVVEQNKCLQQELQPFRDEYFKDLSMVQIAELAKYTFSTKAENNKMADLLEKIYFSEVLNEVNKQKIEEILAWRLLRY